MLVRGGEILLMRRSSDRAIHPGVWDVPGGHREGDETPARTLVRELAEEIGIVPREFEEIAVLPETRPDEYGEAEYRLFVVRAWDGGEPRLLGPEHAELRWVTPDRALGLDLAHPVYREVIGKAVRRSVGPEPEGER
jgi:8-oxo-dGTP pyrophosphatase MutT (NUDIX family)